MTLSVLLDASAKSLFILSVAGIFLILLRRSSAASRHLVLALALGSLLFLPLLSATLPGWQAPIPAYTLPAAPEPAPAAPADEAPVSLPVRTPESPRLHEAAAVIDAPAALPLREPTAPFSPVPAGAWPLLLWLAGFVLALAQIAAGFARLRGIRRHCEPAGEGQMAACLQDLTRQLGIIRPVTLVTARAGSLVCMPMTWGWRRPVICVPADAGAWPPERLRVVLLHELAHVRRGDWAAQTLAYLTCALYWFHPLVWLAARRLRSESERASDDLVLASGVAAPDYAAHLLALVRTLDVTGHPGPAVAMAQHSQIEGRLRAILSRKNSRRGMTRLGVIAALLLAAGAMVPLASLRTAAMTRAAPEPGRKVTLPGGVTVELEGISYYPANYAESRNVMRLTPDLLTLTRPWWTRSGALLGKSPDPRMPIRLLPSYLRTQHKGRLFAFHLSGPSRQEINILWPVQYPKGHHAADRLRIGGRQGTSFQVGAVFPRAAGQSAIRIGIASSSWKTQAISAPSKRTKKRLPSGNTVVFSPAKERRGKTAIIVVDSPIIESRRIVAIDKSGKMHETIDGSASTRDGVRCTDLYFRLPVAEVREFRYQTRPVQWAEFPDVRLEPEAAEQPDFRGLDTERVARHEACMRSLAQINAALLMYAQDYDEKLPPMQTAAQVQNRLRPYVQNNNAVFFCPETRQAYQPNPALSHKALASVLFTPSVITFQDAAAHAPIPGAKTGPLATGWRNAAHAGGWVQAEANAALQTERCPIRLTRMGLALLQYAQDYDGTLPPMKTVAQVQNRLRPYIGSEAAFFCPTSKEAYLPNAALSGRKLAGITSPARTVALRDPKPSHSHGGNVCYVNGDVKWEKRSSNAALWPEAGQERRAAP